MKTKKRKNFLRKKEDYSFSLPYSLRRAKQPINEMEENNMVKFLLSKMDGESKTEFLTRLAGIMDSIKNDVEYEGINYNVILSEEEKNELEASIKELIVPEVVNIAQGIAAEKRLGKQKTEVFVSETVAEVIEKYYRYNNRRVYTPKDGAEFVPRTFSAFIKAYSMAALDRVYKAETWQDQNTSKKLRAIKRTVEFILCNTNFTEDQITEKMIVQYMPNVTKVSFDEDEVRRVLSNSQSVYSIDSYDEGEELVDDTDYFIIADPAIDAFLQTWIDGLRMHSKLIFLQGCEFCPPEYAEMTIKQFSCDECLIKACRMDNIGKKNICHGNLKVEKTHSNTRAEDLDLSDVDYVLESCIWKARTRTKESLKKYILESGIPADELEHQLERFFCRYCDELLEELRAI